MHVGEYVDGVLDGLYLSTSACWCRLTIERSNDQRQWHDFWFSDNPSIEGMMLRKQRRELTRALKKFHDRSALCEKLARQSGKVNKTLRKIRSAERNSAATI